MTSPVTILLTACLAVGADAAEPEKTKPAAVPIALDTEVGRLISVQVPTDLHFSPDGKHVAFTLILPAKGTTRPQQVWILDVEKRQARRFTRSSKSDRSPRWSPDGKTIAFLSDRAERFQVYLIPVGGGEAERLTEGKNAVKAFEWSPDGKHIGILAPDPKTDAEEKNDTDKDDARVVGTSDKRDRLWVVDIATRKVRPLTGPGSQVAEFAWAPTADRLYAIATDRPDATEWKFRLLSITIADGHTSDIESPVGPIRNLRVAPDGKSVTYLAARGDGPAPHDLFLLPVGGKSRNLTSSLFDRPIRWHTWTGDGRLAVLAEDGFRAQGHSLTVDGQIEPWPHVNTNPAPQFARTDAGLLAYVGQTATELPEIWLLPKGSKPAKATTFNDGDLSKLLVRPEFFCYKSFDGTEIEAALYRPRGLTEGTRAPLVVNIHGGPTGRWSDEYGYGSPATQLLAAHGYAVVCPNIRGSTGYGWKFLTMNRGDWGGGDFKDVMAGVDELIRRHVADPDRLAIMGVSYGGYMSAWAITQTNRFKAAVAIAGMSDLASEFGTENGEQAYDRWFYGVPYEAPQGFVHSSPITHIKHARTPTLILHGENDRIDPIGQAQQLHRGLTHYGVDCEFVIYPREGHGFVEEKHVHDYYRRLLGWLDKYVK